MVAKYNYVERAACDVSVAVENLIDQNAVSPLRFPPPWSVEELDACFVVRDHGGLALAYVYFKDEPGRPSPARTLIAVDATTAAPIGRATATTTASATSTASASSAAYIGVSAASTALGQS
jgi:hypothetical protein